MIEQKIYLWPVSKLITKLSVFVFPPKITKSVQFSVLFLFLPSRKMFVDAIIDIWFVEI